MDVETVGVDKRKSTPWAMIALWCVLAVALLGSTLFTVPMMLLSGTGFLIGVVFVAAYITAVTALFRLTPMWPRAPKAWYFSSLLWGGALALGAALLVGGSVTSLVAKLGLHDAGASFGGAYPEEIAKATGVAVILFAFPALNRPWHGFVTGGLVGLGFEAVENVLYGVMGGMLDPNSDVVGTLQMWGLRLVVGPGLHVVFTSIAGLGIGLAFFRSGWGLRKRIGVGLGFLFIAFAAHFAWNYSWGGTIWPIVWLVLVALVIYPGFAYAWWRCRKEAREDAIRGRGAPITSVELL